jgi:hypothetical protein
MAVAQPKLADVFRAALKEKFASAEWDKYFADFQEDQLVLALARRGEVARQGIYGPQGLKIPSVLWSVIDEVLDGACAGRGGCSD